MGEGPYSVGGRLFERSFPTPRPEQDIDMARQVMRAVATENVAVKSRQTREQHWCPQEISGILRNDTCMLRRGPSRRLEWVRKGGHEFPL